MTKKAGPIDDLKSIANVIAQWADQRPAVERVYIFGSHVRGDARPDSDLDIAIEFVTTLTTEATWDWTRHGQVVGAELKAALGGIEPHLHTQKDDYAWPAIREAAKDPVHTVGKVVCCDTPPK